MAELEEGGKGVQELLVLLSQIFEGKYKAEVDGDSLLTLTTIDQHKQIGGRAERLYGLLKRMVDADKLAYVRLGRGDARFTIAHFDNKALDVRDISAFGRGMGGVSAEAMLAHELWEQFNAQVGELEYEGAHASGIEAEEHVMGLDRIGDYYREAVEHDDDTQSRQDVFVHGRGDTLILTVMVVDHNQVVKVSRHDISADAKSLLTELMNKEPKDLAAAMKGLRQSDGKTFVGICEECLKRVK